MNSSTLHNHKKLDYRDGERSGLSFCLNDEELVRVITTFIISSHIGFEDK